MNMSAITHSFREIEDCRSMNRTMKTTKGIFHFLSFQAQQKMNPTEVAFSEYFCTNGGSCNVNTTLMERQCN